jgi:dihydrodipicolinate synthase/N-acetylneuraminate lyase
MGQFVEPIAPSTPEIVACTNISSNPDNMSLFGNALRITQNNMIIYAIPDLTGVNISIEQFGELFNHEKVVLSQESHK